MNFRGFLRGNTISDLGNTVHRTEIDKFFTSLIAHKTQLESLYIRSMKLDASVEMPGLFKFLASQKSLKALGLSDLGISFSELAGCLRSSLKTLTLLRWATNSLEPEMSAPLSPSELEAICDSCPALEYIDIFLPVEDLDVVSATVPISAGLILLNWEFTVNIFKTSNPQIIYKAPYPCDPFISSEKS